jgi:hypothetical protein
MKIAEITSLPKYAIHDQGAAALSAVAAPPATGLCSFADPRSRARVAVTIGIRRPRTWHPLNRTGSYEEDGGPPGASFRDSGLRCEAADRRSAIEQIP